MIQNYSSTKPPTTVTTSPSLGGSSWQNPNNIKVQDGSSSTVGFAVGGDRGADITGSGFAIPKLPSGAVIDGIAVKIIGSNSNLYGSIIITTAHASGNKTMTTLNTTYGSKSDLWGISSIPPADIPGISVTVDANDQHGATGVGAIDYLTITVFWHIQMAVAAVDVPTRIDYKVFSRAGNYLGLLPNVTSKFSFSQDINSAGATIDIISAQYPSNPVTIDVLQAEDGTTIQAEDGSSIFTDSTKLVIAQGASTDEVMFKNSNRIEAWLYNYWYPNGKLMFSGMVNNVSLAYKQGSSQIKLTVYSDGYDLSNYIARGYPFTYTNDQVQTATDGKVSLIQNVYGQWTFWEQSFVTGASTTNIAAISVMMDGIAQVTLSVYDAPNGGNLLGSITQNLNIPLNTVVDFNFATLIHVSPSTTYYIRMSVPPNNSIWLYTQSTDVYGNGTLYRSDFAGGAGGGSFGAVAGDMYFVTKSGVATTTTTYSSQDPVSGMAHGIFADYNSRGGLITERSFAATALLLTYTFVVSTILDALSKILELAPTGYWSYIDLGTSQLDIQPTNTNADFTIVRGKDIEELDLTLAIDQVVNNLLFTGGDPGTGINLFKQYQDRQSAALYGTRLTSKSDNRVTLTATADAIGTTFIAENSSESQATTVEVLNQKMDITKLTPGKTIGFKNFDNFVDNMVLQIARREYLPEKVTLTLGRLPVTMPAEIQDINRQLDDAQTIKNPSSPS